MVAEGLWGESKGQREREARPDRPGETPLDRASLAGTCQRLLAERGLLEQQLEVQSGLA